MVFTDFEISLKITILGDTMITVLKSKIHRIPVTQADLNYEGSISISSFLMTMANISPYERVQVVNINNGERFETYAIPVYDENYFDPLWGRFIGVNGAGARLVQPGDLLIIMTYEIVEKSLVTNGLHEPIVLTVEGRDLFKNGVIIGGSAF